MLTCSSATSKGCVDSSPTEGRRALPTEGCLLEGWDEASPNDGYRGYPLGKFWAANPGAEFAFIGLRKNIGVGHKEKDEWGYNQQWEV